MKQQNQKIKSKKELEELNKQAEFNSKTKVLRVDGKEIGFVYYRTCY